MDETQDCISRGLAVDENNAALKTLSTKVEKRAAHLKKIEDDRKERERIEKAKITAMNLALKVRPRNIFFDYTALALLNRVIKLC